MEELAEQGVAILFVSSEMEEVLEIGAHGILTDRPEILMDVIQE